MFAFSLSVALLAHWFLVGTATLRLIGPKREAGMTTLLLAPAIGITVTLLPAFWLNRWGLPIKAFALPLNMGLLAGAVVTLIVRRRSDDGRAPLRDWLIVMPILLTAMVVAGWPLLKLGFDWQSFGNDDLASYVLGADRILQNPFFTLPSLVQLENGSYFPSLLWLLQVVVHVRDGFEVTLASLAATSRLDTIQLVMSLGLALQAALVCTAGALVYAESQSRSAALIALCVIALNPLTIFGTLSQLFPQAGGLTMMMASIVLLRSPWAIAKQDWFRYVVAAAGALAGLLIWYVELSPLLGLGFLFYLACSFGGWRRYSLRVAALGLSIAAALGVLLGPYLWEAFDFLWVEFDASLLHNPKQIVFSYYLEPAGLSIFWGIKSIAVSLPGIAEPIAIVMGGVLSVAALIVLVTGAVRAQPSACVAIMMLAIGVLLFAKDGDFGLYKLAMYLQPAVIAAVISVIATRVPTFQRSKPAITAVLAVLATFLFLCQARTAWFYVLTASDTTSDPYYFSVKGLSSNLILSQLREKLTGQNKIAFATDAKSATLVKIVGHFTAGRPLYTLSYSPYATLLGSAYISGLPEKKLHEDFLSLIKTGQFTWPTAGLVDHMRFFPADQIPQSTDFTLIRLPQMFSVLNGFSGSSDATKLTLIPRSALHDYLVFEPTELGQDIFAAPDFDRVALGQNEADYFYPGHFFAIAGRYMVFRIIDRDPHPRLVLTITSSLHLNGQTELPPVSVVGDQAEALDAIGRGSARLISSPLTPQRSLGEDFVGIDMGVAPTPAQSKSGFDPRKLATMVRDVSLISDAEYRDFQPPREISHFPADLANRYLEYSGFYEDGWVGQRAFARLGGSTQPATLRLDLEIPRVISGEGSPAVTLTARADGVMILQRTLAPGTYSFRAPLPPSPDRHQIDLQFSAEAPLPGGDGRPVSARITRIGWAPVGDLPKQVTFDGKPSDLGDVEETGLWKDGWLAQRAVLTLAGGDAARLWLNGVVPTLDNPGFRTVLTIVVNGVQVVQREQGPGEVNLGVPIPASDGPRTITIAFSRGQRLPAPDDREAGMQLREIKISN